MANLPPLLTINQDVSTSTNELALHIRSRYLLCRSWIFRPFLYIMVHASPAVLAQYRTELEPLAYTCLECCINCINDTTFHHRHHGTYYMVRVAFAGAMQILAAAKAGFMSMPSGWENVVRRAINIIKCWELECKDLQVSADILTLLLEEI